MNRKKRIVFRKGENFIQGVSMENRQGCIVPQEYFGIRKRRSI